MAITHLMNITKQSNCLCTTCICCSRVHNLKISLRVLWLHPSLCCPTSFKGVAKLHGDILHLWRCVPSPLKHVCFHLNESSAIQHFECGDASKIWWNNRFLHGTVTHLCVCIHTCHSLAHSISKVYNWQTSVLRNILMVKESTESQLSFTFTPQNGEEDMLSEGQHSILSHVPRFTECLEWRQPTEQSFYQHHSWAYTCTWCMFYFT